MRKILSGLCAVGGLTLGAPGAVAAAPSEQDFLGDLPVVLSVSRLAQPQSEAPGSVTVIDAETIKLSGAREIVDLFRLVPGFQVGYSGAIPHVYYHGAFEEFGQHMQVLIDGRSVYSPLYLGGVNWNNVPLALEDIERIEVVRGSNSAAYGSNAFLGVANIITKHPSQTPGWTVVQKGGQGIRDSLVRYGSGDGVLDWRATFGKRSDQGFDGLPSGRDVRHFNLRADWRANLRDEFQFQAGGNNNGADSGYSDDLCPAVGKANDPYCHAGSLSHRENLQSAFVQAKWQRTLSADEFFQIAYHHTEERIDDRFNYGIPIFAMVEVDHGGKSRRDDLEFQHTFSPRPDMRVVWGVEVRHDALNSLAIFGTGDSVTMTMGRLFGNWEWRLNSQLLLNLGTSLERNDLSGMTRSPRLMLSYHLTPDQTFRVGISEATRAPSIFEEKANLGYYLNGGLAQQYYLASGNFQNEEILSKEIGWLGNFRSLGLTADVRLFHERIKGMGVINKFNAPFSLSPSVIAYLSSPAVVNWLSAYTGYPPALLTPAAIAQWAGLGPFNQPRDYFNNDYPSIRGAEWRVEYKPAPGTRFTLNQSFMRIASQYPLPTDLGPADRQEAPSHSTSLSLFQKLPRDMDLSVMLYSVGAMHWPGQPERKVIPGYRRLDVRLAYPFRMESTRGEMSVMVQNLGPSYYETDTYFLFPRRIQAGVSLNF